MSEFDPELLISLYLNGNGLMTKEKFEALAAWIREDVEHTRRFVHAAFSHQATHESLLICDIQKNLQPESSCRDQGSDVPCECDIWEALSNTEKTAESIEIENQEDEEVLENIVVPARSKKPSMTSLLFAIGSVAALIFMLVFVQLNPRVVREEVATITESMDAEWAENNTSALNGDRLFNNSGSLYLLKGLVEIEFDYGAMVIIEGPAEIKLNSPEDMALSYGRLYSYVPENAIGFTVETPYSRIVDLGTEFGVKVDVDGSTDVHMFKGKASLIPGQKGQTSKSQIISVGQSRRIDTSGRLTDILMETKSFVRKIYPKTGNIWRGKNIDLADIVGGGDGFGTSKADIALNPLTGKTVFATMGSSPVDIEENITGVAFTKVPQSEWIDGVFVPDGGNGPVQIAQNGMVFEGFGDTSGKMHAYFQNRKASFRVYDENPNVKNKSCIYMHANLGITFDLDKIRDRFDGQVEIKAFRAQPGFRLIQNNNKADFLVLVDGEVRYKKLGVVASPDLDDVEISINPSDRYLTLATTESDDGLGSDWTMFVDPVLVLE